MIEQAKPSTLASSGGGSESTGTGGAASPETAAPAAAPEPPAAPEGGDSRRKKRDIGETSKTIEKEILVTQEESPAAIEKRDTAQVSQIPEESQTVIEMPLIGPNLER